MAFSRCADSHSYTKTEARELGGLSDEMIKCGGFKARVGFASQFYHLLPV